MKPGSGRLKLARGRTKLQAAVPEQPEILLWNRDHLIAAWRDIILLEWSVETTLPAVERLRGLLGRFVAARPAGAAMFAVVRAEASLPGSDVRASMASTLREYGRNLHASAIVIEGEGFRAAALRSVIKGVSLLSRSPHPQRVFGAVDDGATWLAKVCGHRVARTFDGPQLANAFTLARSYGEARQRSADG